MLREAWLSVDGSMVLDGGCRSTAWMLLPRVSPIAINPTHACAPGGDHDAAPFGNRIPASVEAKSDLG